MKAKTTRLTERFRVHLDSLRTAARKVDDPIRREDLLSAINWLAGSLAMGLPVLEQVEIDVLSPGDLVSLEEPLTEDRIRTIVDEDARSRGAAEQKRWDDERLAAEIESLRPRDVPPCNDGRRVHDMKGQRVCPACGYRPKLAESQRMEREAERFRASFPEPGEPT